MSQNRSWCNYKSLQLSREVYDKWVPVTTTWHILRLQMEEWPPDMEGSCKYIE